MVVRCDSDRKLSHEFVCALGFDSSLSKIFVFIFKCFVKIDHIHSIYLQERNYQRSKDISLEL